MKRWIFCIFVCLVATSLSTKVVLARLDNTCTFKRVNFSDKQLGSCITGIDNCNYNEGFAVCDTSGAGEDEKKRQEWHATFWNGKEDGCGPCVCCENPKYIPNTCTVEVKSIGGLSFGKKRVIPYDKNYCKDGYIPEVIKEVKFFTSIYSCQCKPKTSTPSQNAVDFEYEPRPQDGLNNNVSNSKTEYLYGTNYKLYCEGNDKNNPTIQTSLGCIPITTKGFIAWLLPILFSIAGAVAFLIMVGGFISLSTSEGDPKKMQAAKDTITAAITGLLISLFAIFIVRFIIAYVLKIPGA